MGCRVRTLPWMYPESLIWDWRFRLGSGLPPNYGRWATRIYTTLKLLEMFSCRDFGLGPVTPAALDGNAPFRLGNVSSETLLAQSVEQSLGAELRRLIPRLSESDRQRAQHTTPACEHNRQLLLPHSHDAEPINNTTSTSCPSFIMAIEII